VDDGGDDDGGETLNYIWFKSKLFCFGDLCIGWYINFI